MADIKKRKVTKKDWDKVSEFVKAEHETRKKDKFRSHHETIWKEVDRQINMGPMRRYTKDGQTIDEEWRSVMELGELAKASEIITADVMRLTFPSTRSWFEAHSEPPVQFDPNTGAKTSSQDVQDFNDKALRALMVQQHLDFGLKARYELSVKEALHHGGYVAEARFEYRSKYHEGTGVQVMGAPVWMPYSMWNAYPDPSPSVIGTDMFYTGSMILVDYMPLYILKEIAKGDGWFPEYIDKIPKKNNKNKDVDTTDVELVKRYGDIVINRGDGDIFLPNAKVIIANGVCVYYAPNELPYPSTIYSGYERMDVRDPYYTSPLIKLSPMQKLASQLANKYVDLLFLNVEPPIVYDGNDPQFVLNGGPVIAPGAKTSSKSSATYQQIKIGDPNSALQGIELILQQLQSGLGVNAIRAGGVSGVGDKTATEIQTSDAKAEIRTAEFVSKQERHALRPFLYMQHELNKKSMEYYEFYNPEMDAPDFMRATKQDLPGTVNFEVVGSKGVLGEQARQEKVTQVTAWASTNPLFAPLLKKQELLTEMYRDAGVKDPEKFVQIGQPELPPEIMQAKQQYEQQIQQLQDQIQELTQKLAVSQAVNEAKVSEAMALAEIKKDLIHVQGELELIRAHTKMQEMTHSMDLKESAKERQKEVSEKTQ